MFYVQLFFMFLLVLRKTLKAIMKRTIQQNFSKREGGKQQLIW